MQVFKAFIQIFKRTAVSSMIYLVVFFGIVIMLDATYKPQTIDSFSDTKIAVAVIDRDNSPVSRAVTSYLEETQKLVALEDNEDALQDALFFRAIEYLLVIPEHFGEGLLNGETLPIDSTKIPNSYSGIFIDMQVEEFLRTLRSYYTAGFSEDEALANSLRTLALNVTTTVVTGENAASSTHGFVFYFRMLPYGLLCIIINLIAGSMIEFYQPDIAYRIRCSSLSLTSRSLQLFLGGTVLAVGVWFTMILGAVCMHGQSVFESGMLGWLLLNSAAFTLVSTAVAYLVGISARKRNIVSGVCTSVSLAFCFLGGVFVDIGIMSEGMQKAAMAVPTFWYIKANDIISSASSLTGTARDKVLLYALIQCLFAAAIFCVALVVGKKNINR